MPKALLDTPAPRGYVGAHMRRLLLLFALAAGGCPGRVTYPECKVDEDCAAHGQVCISGFCKECRDDSNCASHPDKPVCRDAICTARPQCASTKDCPAGQKCAEEKCVPECSEATAAQDCGGGKKCIGGRCTAEEACLTDADCGQGRGRACVDRVCKGETLASRTDRLGDCQLRAVYFGFDDSNLTSEARKALDEAWQCLQRATFRRATVAGHCDERGTTEYNVALGMRRAQVVKRYLVGLGADAAKLKAISYGKERPAAPGHDEAAWAKNRRVEMAVEQ
jgi:peptidoglycan-associated lipoprotein